MYQNKQFLKQLQALLMAHPDMTWESDGSEPMQPVRLAWHRLYDKTKSGYTRWGQEPDGDAEDRLTYQADNDVENGHMADLKAMFSGKQLISIKREQIGQPNPEHPIYYDLYILARFGWWYVGFRTKLIET
ncbi:hypothetical protein [Spirosoma pollinicola]|uniref:Uncharacterized protein n=1 Tax=Spirosoma pollinicola TaxID=2057025 RepID=A0A2K8YTQ6_9BACT|nr:hypothetical protein [Spirosoma pollinicola]AUD00948.1 hypothetical protein CWM47_03420 [Spirosoma pollinicola]